MPDSIYLIQGDDSLVEMTEHAYDSEELLQRLLAQYPNLLAGNQVDGAEPRRWLLVSREVPLASEEEGGGRWSVDHLFLDQDAVPTIVEVKRSTDTRIRREVVGQMLDYAANAVVYWPVESLRARFEGACESEGLDADEVLEEFLGLEADGEEFWQKAKTNLQAGKVRLVFVADEIPSELRRIVEFLNEQMDPAEVLAVEIKQYVGGDLKTLVPRVVGQTAEAQLQAGRFRHRKAQWDEPSFLRDLQERKASRSRLARRILEWTSGADAREHGGEKANVRWIIRPNAYAQADEASISSGLDRTQSWTILFLCLRKARPSAPKRCAVELLNRLNSIPEVSVTGGRHWSPRPTILPIRVGGRGCAGRFLETYDWVIEEIEQLDCWHRLLWDLPVSSDLSSRRFAWRRHRKVRRADYVRPTFVRGGKREADLDVRFNSSTRLLKIPPMLSIA